MPGKSRQIVESRQVGGDVLGQGRRQPALIFVMTLECEGRMTTTDPASRHDDRAEICGSPRSWSQARHLRAGENLDRHLMFLRRFRTEIFRADRHLLRTCS